MDTAYSNKRINREILHLMVPTVLESMLQLLAGMVTTAMVGRLMADDIAAQGISSRVYQTFFALFRGLGMGATVVTAIYYGKNQLSQCRRLIEQAFLTSAPIIVSVVLLISIFPEQILSIFTSDHDLILTAALYSRISVWAIPFMSVICFNTAAFTGMGDTKIPMFIALIMNVVNIVIGYVFVFGIFGIGGWGITGAAISTVVSQAVGALIGLILLYNKKGVFRRFSHGKSFFSLDFYEIKNFFSTGIPAAMENLFWQFSAIVMSKVLLGYGNNYYAAYQLGLQAEMFTEMPAQGFIVASTTLSARAIGQKDSKAYKAYFSQLVKMSLVVGALATVVLFMFPTEIMKILTNKPDLQEIGAGYVYLMGFAQVSQVLSKVLNGIIRSSGGKRVPMYIAFIGIWLVRVPLVVLFGWIMKLDIKFIWIVIAFDQFTRVLFDIFYLRYKKIYNYVDNLEQAQ